MGSVKNKGLLGETHWMQEALERIKSIPKKVRQPKSSEGQLPLFEEVPIDHLKRKKKKK